MEKRLITLLVLGFLACSCDQPTTAPAKKPPAKAKIQKAQIRGVGAQGGRSQGPGKIEDIIAGKEYDMKAHEIVKIEVVMKNGKRVCQYTLDNKEIIIEDFRFAQILDTIKPQIQRTNVKRLNK